MRLSKEVLNLTVVVRRVTTGSTPFAWELQNGNSATPVLVSSERFRSMQAAYIEGQAKLAAYASQRQSAKPAPSRLPKRPQTLPSFKPLEGDDVLEEDDDLQEEDDLEIGLVDQPIDRIARSLQTDPAADHVVDATMARSIQTDVARTQTLSGWIVLEDPPNYPGKFIARLVTDTPSPYVLLAESLTALQAQLPPGLVHSDRQVADLPALVEMWFTP